MWRKILSAPFKFVEGLIKGVSLTVLFAAAIIAILAFVIALLCLLIVGLIAAGLWFGCVVVLASIKRVFSEIARAIDPEYKVTKLTDAVESFKEGYEEAVRGTGQGDLSDLVANSRTK